MYYGNPNAVSKSNAILTFDDFNSNFEVDPSGTSGNFITDWDWRDGYSGWRDVNWNNVSWGNQKAIITTSKVIDSSNYFDGHKSYKGYIKLQDTAAIPGERGHVMELYTENDKRIVVPRGYFYVYLKYSYTTSSRYGFGAYIVLYHTTNKLISAKREILVWKSWNNVEGCPPYETTCPYDGYISTIIGNDGTVWKKYKIIVDKSLDKMTLILGLRQWQDAWDYTTASNTAYWDKLEGVYARKYTYPEPTVIIKAERTNLISSRKPYITVELSKDEYTSDDVIDISVKITNPSRAQQIRMKLWITVPSKDYYEKLIDIYLYLPTESTQTIRYSIPAEKYRDGGCVITAAILDNKKIISAQTVYFNVED